MKLFFDENLSHRLPTALADLFPGSQHVRDLGLKASTDTEIWQFAKANEFVIVSKDTDFQQRALVQGFPPKVVWVRLGNCSTSDVAKLLTINYELLLEFDLDEEASFLALS